MSLATELRERVEQYKQRSHLKDDELYEHLANELRKAADRGSNSIQFTVSQILGFSEYLVNRLTTAGCKVTKDTSTKDYDYIYTISFDVDA